MVAVVGTFASLAFLICVLAFIVVQILVVQDCLKERPKGVLDLEAFHCRMRERAHSTLILFSVGSIAIITILGCTVLQYSAGAWK